MSSTSSELATERDSAFEEGQSGGAVPRGLNPSLRWKPGIEVPPFVLSNVDAVNLCCSILDGTIVEVPSLAVSEAIAIQVSRMLHSGDSRFGKVGWHGVYTILATLWHRGTAPPPAGSLCRCDSAVTALR